ncbi:Carbohydrate-Binding Module Family 1 protein, cellulose binding protein [Pseudohyphozyma bogoriensis]|nr:Carbohydrate-Binding Module Family 1 protein, cellulose binding protein [Pseudohyphozyma bogoriensis]
MASFRRASSASSFATLSILLLLVQFASAAVFSCVGGSVYVVAHPDDDLLFQSPDLYSDTTAGNCITTIFLTSGDSGIGSTYAQSREAGNEAATALMAGVADSYTEINATFGGQPVLVRTLVGAPQNQKVWFRLPDGGMNGNGYSVTGYESLRELYFGSIGSITNQPGYATYTMATLKQAIAEILTARQPIHVRTLDYLSQYDGGDHADHLTVARITQSLVGNYASNATFDGYMGYPVANLAPTLDTSDPLFVGKSNAFFAYTPYDSGECQAYSVCVANGRGEASWLTRQYIVTSELAEESQDGSAEDPVTLPSLPNIALIASVTASSAGDGQPGTAAIDNVISGYPGNSSAEWSSNGEGAGATYNLTWPITYNVSSIALYDRPNSNDWMQAGTLTFSDSSVQNFGVLNNDGSATLIVLDTPVITNSILLTVTAVSGATSSVGLSEFQVYGVPCVGCTAANITQSINTKLIDLALLGTATASSYNDPQTPAHAIDGIAEGYPADYTKEWSSNDETVGAWITISWPRMYSIDSVVLYDRPNLNDWITGGTLTFSDGSQVTTGSLANNGAATTFTFPTVNTTSIQFSVTSVGSSSSAVGLAEFAAFFSGTQPLASDFPDYTLDVPASGQEVSGEDLLTTATCFASSYAAGQGPDNAVDGIIGGYAGGSYDQEWATSNEGAGAWLNCSWDAMMSLTQIILYDRPNLNDQVLSGTLTFDDGSYVAVPTLLNDGGATSITFSAKNTSSILFQADSVSSTTGNVGLAEMAAYGDGFIGNITWGLNEVVSDLADVAAEGQDVLTGDLALNATCVASSSADSQGPENANDGIIGGYGGGSYLNEWATSGGGAGSWIKCSWDGVVSINQVILYDRPNDNDQITGGTLSFDDGSTISVSNLYNDGGPTSFTFDSRNTSSVLFTITSVSDTTSSAGLAELAVYGEGLLANVTSTLNSTLSNLPDIAAYGQDVIAGDLALGSNCTATSYSAGQEPWSVVDGIIGGYGGGSWTNEWASSGGGKGTWINCSWSSLMSVNQVILYDRPNSADQVTAGLLTFDDGSVVSVGSLYNDGGPTSVLFSSRNTKSILFTITAVSSTTGNVGLAEMAVYGAGAVANLTTSLNSTLTNTTLSSNSTLGFNSTLGNATLSSNSTLTWLNGTLTSLNATSTINGTSWRNATSTNSSSVAVPTTLPIGGNYTYNSTASLNDTLSSLNGTSTYLNGTSTYLNGTSTYLNGTSTYLNGTLSSDNSTYLNATSTYDNSTAAVAVPTTLPIGGNSTAWLNETLSSLNGTLSAANGTLTSLNATSTINGTSTYLNGTYDNSTAAIPVPTSLPVGGNYTLNLTDSLNSSIVSGASAALSGVVSGSVPLPTATSALNDTSLNATYANASAAVPVPTALPTSGNYTLNTTLDSNSSILSSVLSGYSALPTALANATSALANASVAVPTGIANATSSLSLNSSVAVPTGSVASGLSGVVGGLTSALFGANATSTGVNSSSSVTSTSTSSSAAASASCANAVYGTGFAYGQCGGIGYSGATCCPSGYVCTYSNAYYSQCIPGSASSSSSSSTTVTPAPTTTTSSTTKMTTTTKTTTTSAAPTGPATATPSATQDIALLAKATSSCANSASPASGAIDDKVGGTSLLGTGKAAQEWKCSGTTKGAWLNLTWTEVYPMKSVILYGPVNTVNSITSGTLTFSDGTVVDTGAISSSGTIISLGTGGIYAQSVLFTVNTMSLLSTAAGLAEIRIYNQATSSQSSLLGAVTGTVNSLLSSLGL